MLQGLTLGGTKWRRNLHQALQASLQWDTGKFKLFYLFTGKEKPQFPTLEGLTALWAASGIWIADTCENIGLWMFCENTATVQQSSCSCNKSKWKTAIGEMWVWEMLPTPQRMLFTALKDGLQTEMITGYNRESENNVIINFLEVFFPLSSLHFKLWRSYLISMQNKFRGKSFSTKLTFHCILAFLIQQTKKKVIIFLNLINLLNSS